MWFSGLRPSVFNVEYVFCIYTVLVAHRQLVVVPIGVLVVAVAIWISVMVSIG
jgi:hypothetical protein